MNALLVIAELTTPHGSVLVTIAAIASIAYVVKHWRNGNR